MKKIIGFGVGLALAAFLTTAANAQVTFEWVPDTAVNTYATTGTLTELGGIVTSFTFTEAPDGLFGLAGFPGSSATGIVLSDGDFQLNPEQVNFNGTYVLAFLPNGPGPSADEQRVNDNGQQYGDWVAVPEPTTIISGAMLLLPFGASTLRILRRRQVA